MQKTVVRLTVIRQMSLEVNQSCCIMIHVSGAPTIKQISEKMGSMGCPVKGVTCKPFSASLRELYIILVKVLSSFDIWNVGMSRQRYKFQNRYIQ